jgi:membrane protein YdbS with pleckstrin-like domain
MDPQSTPQPNPPSPGPAADKPAVERFRDTASTRMESGGEVDKEEMLWQGGYSGKDMIGTWILALLISIATGVLSFMFLETSTAFIVLLVVLAVVWGGSGLMLLYRRLDKHYELSSQRFVHKEGILKRVTNRIEVIDIDDVTFSQGLIQRMLGVGTITIVSSDRSHPKLSLFGIDEVKRVAGLIDDVRRRERRKRGLHIEAI